MKALRTIRFDASDTHVFARAAEPGEWAIPGSFAFTGDDAGALTGKDKQAFANGFLGLTTFGRSTFVSVCEASASELSEATGALCRHFVACCGAPDEAAALHLAREELDFAGALCADAQINTLFSLRRTITEAGDIKEEFRIVQPSSEPLHSRIWDVSEDD